MNKRHLLYITGAIFFLSIILTFFNYIWIKDNLSHIPPPWDQSFYIYMGLNEYDALMNGNIHGFIKTIIRQAPNLAPLFPVTTVPFFILFGPGIHTAYLANSLYLFILLVSLFLITDRLAGRTAAMFSIFLAVTFPAIITYSRDYMFEFPLASLTALSYLFMLKSDSFRCRGYSLLSGFCAGLSVLVKTMGIVFFVFPFLYAVYIFTRSLATTTARKNILYFLSVFFITISIFFIFNYNEILKYLLYYGFGEGSKNYNFGMPDMFSFQYWAIYLKHIAGKGISYGYAIIFIGTAISAFCFRDRRFSQDYRMVWLWFITGYILLSLSPNKGGERYALPILVPLASLLAVHIMQMSGRVLKSVIILLAVLIGIINYSYHTLSDQCRYKQFSIAGVNILEPLHASCIMQEEVLEPHDKNWDVTQIARAIENLAQGHFRTVHVLIAFDHHFLNINTLMLYQKIDKINGVSHINFIFEKLPGNPVPEDEIRKSMERSQFIVTKNGFQGPVFSNGNNDIVKNALKDRTPAESFTMSDGSEVFLYSFINLANDYR